MGGKWTIYRKMGEETVRVVEDLLQSIYKNIINLFNLFLEKGYK